MKLLCRRKLKIVVYLVVATFLVVDITQRLSPSYQVHECGGAKAALPLATGLGKPDLNQTGESQSLNHVIYPEVTVVPRIVYYLWCNNKTFEFKHYLSVLSVVRFVRPEKIVFVYGTRPPVDRYMYNTWLAELTDTLSYLVLEEMPARRYADVCRDQRSRRAYIVSKITKDGGIFVGKNTIFTRELRGLNESFTTKLLSSFEGYIMSKSNVGDREDAWPRACLHASDYESRKPNSSDVTTHVCEYRAIYPRDIMRGDGAFTSLARSLFYGDAAAPMPRIDAQRLSPNIAHMLWIGGTQIDFLFYLSALSLLYVVNVERLFIHGDLPPSGYYWRRLEGQARITYVPCAKPNVAFGHLSGSKHHMSDIFRAQVMIKYGGIYSDVDVIWTRAPSVEMRSYEAVASFDWATAYVPYPNYINLGVSLGQRGSRFWRLFHNSLKTFRDDIFGFNGLLQPYKVYERHPDTIHMDDHLQVMCFRTRCYPRWGVAFESIDWRNDAHAVHWTWPTPAEFKNQETLVNATGTWAEIGQNVLRHAGLLDAKAQRGGR